MGCLDVIHMSGNAESSNEPKNLVRTARFCFSHNSPYLSFIPLILDSFVPIQLIHIANLHPVINDTYVSSPRIDASLQGSRAHSMQQHQLATAVWRRGKLSPANPRSSPPRPANHRPRISDITGQKRRINQSIDLTSRYPQTPTSSLAQLP